MEEVWSQAHGPDALVHCAHTPTAVGTLPTYAHTHTPNGAVELCGIMRITAVRCCSSHTSLPLSGMGRAFLAWIQKCTKKITPMKKQPDNFLHSAEISQTHLRSDMRNFGHFISEIVRAVASSRAGASFRPSEAFSIWRASRI